ncbi:MAG: hypothetical protein WAR37_04085 [Candidatus Microsaccharimonas sp.]
MTNKSESFYGELFHAPLLTREEEARLDSAIQEANVLPHDDSYTASSKVMEAALKVGIDITNLEALPLYKNPPRLPDHERIPDSSEQIEMTAQQDANPEGDKS